jgi:hypothetical protein
MDKEGAFTAAAMLDHHILPVHIFVIDWTLAPKGTGINNYLSV